MNEDSIENALRHTPKPPVPSALLGRLQEDLRQQFHAKGIQNRNTTAATAMASSNPILFWVGLWQRHWNLGALAAVWSLIILLRLSIHTSVNAPGAISSSFPSEMWAVLLEERRVLIATSEPLLEQPAEVAHEL